MLKQFQTAILLGLRTIPSRKGASLVIVISMACAVGALVSIQSMSAGFAQMIRSNGRDDRAMVLSRSAIFEFVSSIPTENISTIANAPGIRRGADGKPVLSAEATAFVVVPKKSDGLEAFITVRGMGPEGMALRPEIRLTSGRMFRPGKYEVIVGKSAAAEFAGLTENARVSLPDGDWTIVGTFEAGGSALESSLLTDADTLMASMRSTAYRSVTVMLNSPASFAQFKNALTTNPTLTVDVVRETDYNAEQARTLNGLLDLVAGVVGGIMGLGAMFGALNTMYSAVSTRGVEIATLRAIGFGGMAVMASVLAEALLLALAGSLIGAALAWIAFNGNLHAIGGNVIRLTVTPGLIGNGVLFACLLGFVGGFFPALRAARRPVAEALRAS
jgi:putative ABC transport system permease protein